MIYQSGFGRSRLPEANCLLLKKGCRQAFLVLAKTKTDNIYWSSSEFYNNPANNALYVNVNNGNVNNNNKNNRNSYVRPVLAFSIKIYRSIVNFKNNKSK